MICLESRIQLWVNFSLNHLCCQKAIHRVIKVDVIPLLSSILWKRSFENQTLSLYCLLKEVRSSIRTNRPQVFAGSRLELGSSVPIKSDFFCSQIVVTWLFRKINGKGYITGSSSQYRFIFIHRIAIFCPFTIRFSEFAVSFKKLLIAGNIPLFECPIRHSDHS